MKTKFMRKLAVILSAVCTLALFSGLNISAAQITQLLIGEHITYMYSTDNIVLVSENPDIVEVREYSVYGISEGIANVYAINGDTIYKTYTFSVSPVPAPYLMGDINSDQNVDCTDIAIFQKYLAKKPTVIKNFMAADMNEDECVDIFDLIFLKRYVTSLHETPPTTEPIVTTTPKVTTTTVSTTKTTTTTLNPEQVARQNIEEVVSIVNVERAKQGIAPLTLDETMTDAAMLRAEEITDSFSHTRPDGTKCFTVLDQFGLNFSYVAENIAAGSSTPEGTMNQWINSTNHYKNLMNSQYTEIGVGYCYDPNSPYGYYWVQLFRKP